MDKKISVAIDGPAGAGKSTIARRVAKELGYYYVDTGAIYRTVAYFLDVWGVSPKDIDGINRYLDELNIDLYYDEEGTQHMIMNGMDVTEDIRSPEISQKASSRCISRSISRTTAWADTRLAFWEISGERMSSVTSMPFMIMCWLPSSS